MATTAAPRVGTANRGRARDPLSAVKTAFAVLVLGVGLLLFGFGAISESHENPDLVTCNSQQMQPGDTCTTYSNSRPVRTEGYEQMRADHVSAVERDKALGPLLVVIGSLVVGGVVLSGVVALSKPGRS